MNIQKPQIWKIKYIKCSGIVLINEKGASYEKTIINKIVRNRSE